MIRAASYARFSTEMQRESSITDQQMACRDYAKAYGMTIVKEFSDSAISGAALGNRPSVLALQKMAFAGEIDVILVADLTRLSRNSADLQKFLERLRFKRVRVVGVLDQFDSEQRHSRMQAGLSGIMSDEYRLAVSERVHLALKALARNSKPMGAILYGYTSKQVIIPEQARIVKEIFKRFAAGDKARQIASDLNRRAVATVKGGPWTMSTLKHILRNERFAGVVMWNRTQGVKDPDSGIYKFRARPRSEWIIDERPDQRIVDRALFDRVQKRFERQAAACGPQGGGRRRYVLSGLLECGVCGGSFVMTGGGKNRQTYQCGRRHFSGDDACSNNLRVGRPLAEELLVKPAFDEFLSESAVAAAVSRIRQALKTSAQAPVVDVSAIEAKLKKVRALEAAGTLDAEMAEPIYAKLQAERSALVHRAKQSKARVAQLPIDVEKEYRAQVARMRADLVGSDADMARAALAPLLDRGRIRLNPDPKRGVLVAEVVWAEAAAAEMAQGGGGLRISLPSKGLLGTHIPLIRQPKK